MRSPSSKSTAVAHVSAFVLALVAALSVPVLAASLEVSGVNARAASPAADAPHLQPNALLTIDQNRATVVDRVVREWGDALVASSVGLDREQLRAMLTGLRSDHLLAASLAGSLEGLRNSLATALASSAEVSRGLVQAKALGDTGDDLVYTPVVPCRLADTRLVGGPIAANTTRNFKVWVSSGGFTAQGGDAGNCSVPADPPAVVLDFAAVNPGGTGNLIAYPTGGTLPNTSVLNYQSGIAALSNGAIIPACVPSCTNQLSVKANGPTVDVVIDIVGYFARPKNYGGTHVITGLYATDSGGYGNTASGYISTVAGGYTNTASGYISTVGGGNVNTASGGYSTVGGGANNTASGGGGSGSTVAGGINNTASGASSTVAGGFSNTASGTSSTVAGGESNSAGGTYSFAAGTLADAANNGCFVWGDHSNTGILSCLAPNEVDMRAMGGFFFVTGGTRATAYTGAQLPGGAGAWTTLSDRSSKEHVLPVDARAVLRKIATLPIATWNWTAQGAATRHMGPMAQDFRAAFGLGEDDRHISTVDAEGVALAAIQGLHQMVRERERALVRVNSRLSQERTRVESLSMAVEEMKREVQRLRAAMTGR